MNNAPAILKSLIIYAICVPLAIWVGYSLTSIADFSSRSSLVEGGLFALLLCTPLLLRWHYVLMFLTLNLSMTVFFLPGTPPLWMVMMLVSLGISVLQRTLNRGMHFLSAPQLARPLICMAVVVLFTCKLTGGIGLHSLGSENMGGKKYFFVIGGILSYFAITAYRIPANKVGFYIALFFLPVCLSVIGDLDAVLPSSFNFLFWFFPPNGYVLYEMQQGTGGLRLAGLAAFSLGIFTFMLAKYGIRGIFLSGSIWRPVVFVAGSSLVVFGGFRSQLVEYAILFGLVFFIEGMHRSKLLPRFAFAGLLAIVLIVPFSHKLPMSVQRTLSFLPLDVDVAAKADAEDSAEWRYKIWQAEYPQVPHYLLLGKGYILTQMDYDFATSRAFGIISADQNGSAVAGDYHSGPLSLVIPFGIWGVIAFVWFLIAGGRALYSNYRYGDESLRTINTFLLAYFLSRVFAFIFIFGGLEGDMFFFASLVGLGVSLNGGIRRKPGKEPVTPAAPAISRPRLQVGFQR
jgi:hypothetical protein